MTEYSPKREFAGNFGEMLDSMEWRGRDQRSIHEYATCKVGFRRLAITDIGTPQPGVASYLPPDVGIEKRHDFEWEVFTNGEIYNYKDLGFQGSECEVLAQGFAKYGPKFVKRLSGMFVIVAIQGENVWVFRDRYGIKPFYWFDTKAGLVLASEIKPILKHPEYRFAVNEAAKAQWLTFNNVLTDDTLFQGIRKMEKGTYWHLNTGAVTKYWQWDFTPIKMDYQEAVSEVRRLVIQSVERMTPKEVPFGCSLSGGIDSGIIANLLPDCHTFTVGFTEGSDERALAELSGKQQYEIVYNQVRHLEETVFHLEDLRVGASWSNYGLYQLASKFVKVIFDGAGADELFGGYGWRYTEPDYWNIVNRTGVESEYCRRIFEQAFVEDTLAERFKFDAEYFLEGVLLVGDRLSMAHTIECRLPFLDNDLMDFALTLPMEYKQNKRILKDAFSDILPSEVLNAKKRGWTSPDWIEGQGNQARKWSEAALAEWNNIFNNQIKNHV